MIFVRHENKQGEMDARKNTQFAPYNELQTTPSALHAEHPESTTLVRRRRLAPHDPEREAERVARVAWEEQAVVPQARGRVQRRALCVDARLEARVLRRVPVRARQRRTM
jgi:hypothetical protein